VLSYNTAVEIEPLRLYCPVYICNMVQSLVSKHSQEGHEHQQGHLENNVYHIWTTSIYNNGIKVQVYNYFLGH